jgi:hypothetical protein
LAPLGSRIGARLRLESASDDELRACLVRRMSEAGAPKLMTDELVATLAAHALGNYRVLTTMAYRLLGAAAHRKREMLEQGLYLEVFEPDAPSPKNKKRRPT